MHQFYPLTVSEITPLTPNAVDISFEIPESLKEAFAFESGQYITIKHTAGDSEIRRAYSLSSKPGGNKITIGVKKVPGGTFSVYANQTLKKEMSFRLCLLRGAFYLLLTGHPGIS